MKIRDGKKSYPNKDGNTEDEEIVGVLSIRDFLPLFSRSATSNSTNNSILNTETSEALSITAKDISSDLVSVNKNASIKEATNIMINRQIRNIGIKDKDSNLIGLINDRIVLEFLLRYMRTKDSSSIIDPENNIQKAYYKEDIVGGNSISNNAVSNMCIINNLRIVPLSEVRVVDDSITVSQASELLMNVHDRYLILKSENAIVTPWDIVMKTIKSFTNYQ